MTVPGVLPSLRSIVNFELFHICAVAIARRHSFSDNYVATTLSPTIIEPERRLLYGPNVIPLKGAPSAMPTRALPCCHHTIVEGNEQLVIETASGQRITLQQSSVSVLIEDGNGNTIRLEPSGITINSTANVVLYTSHVEINASMVTVNAPMAKFSGVLQTDILIANSVVASSYTPGAGNIW